MKKKLSLHEWNLLLILAGLILFLLAYFLIFLPLQDSNSALDAEIRSEKARLTELQGYYENQDTYKRAVSDAEAETEDFLQRLPGGLEEEDFLLYLADMHAQAGSTLKSVSFDSDGLISQFDCIIDGENQSVSGHRVVSTSTALMSYVQLKDCLTYIYSTQDFTWLDSVSVTYDSETTLLDTVFTISKLYAEYEGSTYHPSALPKVPTGTADPFGTDTLNIVQDIFSEP